MKGTKIAIVGLVLVVCLLSTALGLVWMQKSVSNTMSLNAQYDIAVYESGTTTPCTSITWGTFNESEVKTHNIDLKYLGNGQGTIYWSATVPVPDGWTLTVAKAPQGSGSYTEWLSGEANKLTGIASGYIYYVKFTLTETTAMVLTPYNFTVTFCSIYT